MAVLVSSTTFFCLRHGLLAICFGEKVEEKRYGDLSLRGMKLHTFVLARCPRKAPPHMRPMFE
jgi:hypothetical protein